MCTHDTYPRTYTHAHTHTHSHTHTHTRTHTHTHKHTHAHTIFTRPQRTPTILHGQADLMAAMYGQRQEKRRADSAEADLRRLVLATPSEREAMAIQIRNARPELFAAAF